MRSIIWGMIFLAFLITLLTLPVMPARIAIHWDSSGAVNGYSGKPLGSMILPVLLLTIGVLYELIPRIDPKRENIESSRRAYDLMFMAVILFLLVIQVFVLLWNLGYKFQFNSGISAAFGILFVVLGYILGDIRPNWFVGIRTPWTLSSEYVWKRTHSLGQKLFILSGLISFFGVLFPEWAVYLILVPVVLSSVSLVVYSYWVYCATQSSRGNPND